MHDTRQKTDRQPPRANRAALRRTPTRVVVDLIAMLELAIRSDVPTPPGLIPWSDDQMCRWARREVATLRAELRRREGVRR